MTKKAKGPATAPTVPSHGSITHPCMRKDEMNVETFTTAPAATLDIADLENPLADATRMASITSRLIGDCLGGPNKGNKYYLTPTQIEDMLFATYQVEDLIRKIYATWELILTGAGRTKESDPIIAAIAAYRDGIQKYNNVPDNEEDEKNYLWREPWNVLKSWDQPCRSREGAAEAIRLALYEDDIGESQLPAPLMGAALAYLEGSSA